MNFSNIAVIVNSTLDYQNNQKRFEFSLHELHFDVVITDYFDNLLGPVNVSVNCVGTLENTSNYYIDSLHHNVTLTNDSIVRCGFMNASSDSLFVTLYFSKNKKWITNVDVPIHWGQDANCNTDIAHILLHQGVCVLLDCAIISAIIEEAAIFDIHIMGLHCDCGGLSISSGYWFSNGYQHYIMDCPSGHCNTSFNIMYYNGELFHESYPDSSVQCLTHWSGLACGECYSNNYSIQFDTSDCIPLDQCFKSSWLPNLALLLSSSFLYWCLVISFVFVLLHFQFDVTAEYAYGVIFYYSVLEVIVKMLIKSQYIKQNFVDISLQALPFLSNVGYLKPPFLKYLQLCLGGAETIDHVFINYIHPLIVTCLVAIIFITARRYVIVARLIGRYVNSKSICLLLLFSYSSVCYTSVQLLKPLAVFEGLSNNIQWHTYLSPTVQYFHDRHILYGIMAILCELIIGIGLPLLLLFQRYLIRYFNLRLIAIKPVIDQLQGCYREDYRWFAAYYLLCRQVIYAIDITSDFVFVTFKKFAHDYVKNAPIMVTVALCILMLVIHLRLQPYKRKGLNILDGVILLTLLFLMVTGAIDYQGMGGCDDGVTMVLFITPLLILVNYLALGNIIRYILIPASCIGIMCMEIFITWHTHYKDQPFNFQLLFYALWMMNIFHILILLTSLICLIVYIVWELKRWCTRHHRRDYALINRHDDGQDEDSDIDDGYAITRLVQQLLVYSPFNFLFSVHM